MKKHLYPYVLTLAFISAISIYYFSDSSISTSEENQVIPEKIEEEEYNEERMKLKMADWTPEDAARQQAILLKYQNYFKKQGKSTQTLGGLESFGTLQGTWTVRGPRNMPGAFKFAEMLEGTDTIYGVTHNHYSGEFNSKSYIFRGTVYNPKLAKGGDDFVKLTGHWPNKYRDLIVFKYNGKVRLIAGIENGPVYYSDDEGQTWTLSSNAPSVTMSTILNRQDGLLYCTDGKIVLKSTNGGQTFTSFKDFGSIGDAVLYSPRYAVQQDAEKVYLAREGVFYELNAGKTDFTTKGTYTGGHSSSSFSIGGDSRKLYVTENSRYYVSTDNGISWQTKTPKGNWYGDRTGTMSAGMFLAVSPENTDHVCGGYAQPVFSTDGLNTDVSTSAGWGNYQNGTSLPASQYYDRIRFNYHPDIQAQHFFYNSTGDLMLAMCTDGGIFVSYKAWTNHSETVAYDNSVYANAHFINCNTLNTPVALIYRNNLFTGNKNPNHIIYSTQDQGSHDVIPGSTGDLLDFYQTIGGDGPPLNSADGNWVWKWQREGKEVWAPVELYDASGNLKRVGTVSNSISSNQSVTFPKTATVGWLQTYIDRAEPSKRMWLLGKNLNRVTVSGASVTGSTITQSASNQITAFTQAAINPDKVWFLQEGKVYHSTNRGDSFGNAISTPFSKTSNNQNLGGGWVLPQNDNWILFAGPSANSVGAILSKDGGQTWTDVTGDFPSGDDFQVGGVVGTPDGKYVFAGTDVGPFVFVVAEEKWYPMFTGAAPMFNTTAIEYIASEKIVRFGAWGSGVLDFKIDDGSPTLTINSMNSNYKTCDSLVVNWTSNVQAAGVIKLLKGGLVVETWNISNMQKGWYAWLVPDQYTTGTDYEISISAGGIAKTSNTFEIATKSKSLLSSRLTVIYVDSEHNASRLANNTIDGNTSTFWHTEWSPGNPAFPHTIVFESDTIAEWTSISCLARQDGSANGRVKDYKVYGSTDNINWTLMHSGVLSNDASLQEQTFNNAMTCKYIKFEALSEQANNFYASMAEISFTHADPCTPLVTSFENKENDEYKVFPTLLNRGENINIIGYQGVLEVYNLSGQLVKNTIVNSNRYQLITNELKSGTYIIKMAKHRYSKKILIR